MDIPDPVGLPNTVNYDLPPKLPDSANARFVSIAPNGITQTSTISIPTTVFTANQGGPLVPFIQQLFQFDIPCGSSPSTFIDTTSTTLNFRLVWNLQTLATGLTGTCNIISSMASWISSIILYSNNVPLETINNYDLLHNLLLNSTLNVAQRQANAWQFGADSNTFTGIDLPVASSATVTTYYINVSLPLVSLIGVNYNTKMFPVGMLQNLSLQVLTNQFAPISFYCSAVTGQPAATMTLDTWSLCLKYVDLGPELAPLFLSQNLKNGKLYIKASSYTNSNVTIPSGSSGSQSLIFQLRNSSIKSIYAMIGSTALPAVCPNLLYDSINPALTSLQLAVPSMGFRLPNKPMNPSQRPAEVFNHYSMAFGSGPASSYMGVVGAETFHNHYGTLISGCDSRWVIPATATRTLTGFGNNNSAYGAVASFPNMFYIGFDTEKTSSGSSIFQGINTRSCPPQLDIVIGSATGQTLQVTGFALIDVICVIDVESKSIMVYN